MAALSEEEHLRKHLDKQKKSEMDRFKKDMGKQKKAREDDEKKVRSTAIF